MNDKMIVSAMALDLKRASLGTNLFLQEFFKKKSDLENISQDIKKVIDSINFNTDKEDLLMYSNILQNYGRANTK